MSNRNSSTIIYQIPNDAARHQIEYCRRFRSEQTFMENVYGTLASITLSVLSCPAIILMNLLMIVAVKTRPRLQSNYNILLVCLAASDLLVGTLALPAFIAQEIFALAGGSEATYCFLFRDIIRQLTKFLVFGSLFHLVLVSVERYIALKYALQYDDIVTKHRLAKAVVLSWFLEGLLLFSSYIINYSFFRRLVSTVLVSCSLIVIVYCHITAYVITRRHTKQIRSEQIPGEATLKFLKGKKAWKTTGIILGFLFLSFLPVVVNETLVSLGKPIQSYNAFRPVFFALMFLSSLCNPIIYCFRSTSLRKAMLALLKRQTNNNN